MPDSYGRPTMQDWMGLATSFTNLQDQKTKNTLAQQNVRANDRKFQYEDEFNDAAKRYATGQPVNAADYKHQKAVNDAYFGHLANQMKTKEFQITNQKMIAESAKAQKTAAFTYADKAEAMATLGDIEGAVRLYAKANGAIANGVDIDISNGEIVITDNLTGSVTRQPIGNGEDVLDQAREQFKQIAHNDEAFFETIHGNRQKLIQANLKEAADGGVRMKNKEGKEIRKLKQFDPNSGDITYVYIDGADPSRSYTEAEVKKGGYHTMADIKEDLGIKNTESLISLREQQGKYYAAGINAGAGKGISTRKADKPYQFNGKDYSKEEYNVIKSGKKWMEDIAFKSINDSQGAYLYELTKDSNSFIALLNNAKADPRAMEFMKKELGTYGLDFILEQDNIDSIISELEGE